MASTLPPVKGVAFSFPITLVSQAVTDVFKETVTLAAGDIQVSKDMRAFTAKGRLSPLLETIPVRVILNEHTALLGAGRCALLTGE